MNTAIVYHDQFLCMCMIKIVNRNFKIKIIFTDVIEYWMNLRGTVSLSYEYIYCYEIVDFHLQTKYVCETQMPMITANAKDGQNNKDKYLNTSRKILSQEMGMCRMKALIQIDLQKVFFLLFLVCFLRFFHKHSL